MPDRSGNKPGIGDLEAKAADIRRKVLELSFSSRSGHIGPSLSCVDILAALFFHYLRGLDSSTGIQNRDHFILSKGHAAAPYYACLCARGLITPDCLEGFGRDGGTLRHHPDAEPEFGIEVTTGSLGHGLGIGAGLAFGGRCSGLANRTVVLMSDGELNEGTVWEAAMFAAHHGLESLLAIVDSNRMQALGTTKSIIDMEDLIAKWQAFGWGVRRLDGHDIGAIVEALDALPFSPGRPSIIIADTIKGKGVSFMEGELLWHYRCPDDREFSCAMRELERDENDHD